jgi:hypothetical protein
MVGCHSRRIQHAAERAAQFRDLPLRSGSAHTIMHIYMIKIAAVFMMTASTLAIYVRFVLRWLALLGYLLSLFLLFES